LNWLRINVPSNWPEIEGQDAVQFAPTGAYGDQGITRGIMTGRYQGRSGDLESASEDYLAELLQGNTYLSQKGAFVQTTVAGRSGYTTSASGRSPVTGKTEIVTIYTTRLRTGGIFYVVTVVPSDESYLYNSTFRNILNSIQLADR
jgi:hypothetical protein